MKMLFFGTKTYDREFFDKGLKEERYKDIYYETENCGSKAEAGA